jgi:hypothetical protein
MFSNGSPRQLHARHARASKAMLLPLPKAEVISLSLQYHCAIEALHCGKGYPEGAQALAEMILLTSFLADAGRGMLPLERLAAGQMAIAQLFGRGKSSGDWHIDESEFASLAAIAELHDAQLRKASLKEWSVAADKLERVRRERPIIDGQTNEEVTE